MRCVRGAASIIALAAWATSATAAPYHLPGKGEDFRPPPPATTPSYDPYQRPAADRPPDAYVDGRPYWFGSQVSRTLSQVTRTPPVQARAEVRPPPPASPPAGYDPYRPPVPDRMPDVYEDGRPYWFPAPIASTPWVQTPAGYVVQPLWSAEFGARYFPSSGTTKLDLFAFPPLTPNNVLVSRLTYRDLLAHSGELYGRLEHGTGLFVKGFIGGGVIPSGTLQDEDFLVHPLFPYSSTDSEQRNGRLIYGSVDFGWAFRTVTTRTSFFAGYFYSQERLNAFGCTQTAGNPLICAPGDVAPSTEVIRQETNWGAVRVGISGEWRVTERWKVTAEAAWLPYVHVDARDTHLLRLGTCLECFSGPTPETGSDAINSSVQLEAILSYYVTDAFSVGIGGRYWNIHPNPGSTTVHFEETTLIFGPQAASLRTVRWGAFLQASYKFGRLEP
jgi:hypothetical protein